jgi:hypothetical protein
MIDDHPYDQLRPSSPCWSQGADQVCCFSRGAFKNAWRSC